MTNAFYTFYATGLKAIGDDFVEGYISTSDKDLVNDVVTDSCMLDMLAQLNERNIKLDLEHEAFLGNNKVEKELNKTIIPAGRIVSAAYDTKGIKVTTQINKDYPRYDMLKSNIKNKFLDAFSIAYVPLKFSLKGDERYLEKINLLNVAFTGNPVNPKASFTNVLMKSLDDLVKKNDEGGLDMESNEKKVEEVSDSAFEVKSLVDKFEALESQVAELKSLVEKKDEEKAVDKEIDAEKKEDEQEDDAEKVDAEAKSKEFEAKLKAIEEKQAEIDKVLSAPIFKARAEIMQKALKEEADAVKDKEVKSFGTLDLIK